MAFDWLAFLDALGMVSTVARTGTEVDETHNRREQNDVQQSAQERQKAENKRREDMRLRREQAQKRGRVKERRMGRKR